MTNVFGDIETDGMEEARDVLGGFVTYPSDVYLMTILNAYATTSQGGAKAMNYIFQKEDGKEYRETIYATSKTGKTYFHPKDKDGKEDTTKKQPLPGYTHVNDIAMMTVEKELKELTFEDKMVKVYDSDQQKEIPKSVPVAVELLGKQVKVALLQVRENKNVKQGNVYVPTAETRDTNQIDKVFHPTLDITMSEARGTDKKPEFMAAWLEKNKGVLRDKTKKDGVKSGKPGAGNKPTEGAAEKRQSLFS